MNMDQYGGSMQGYSKEKIDLANERHQRGTEGWKAPLFGVGDQLDEEGAYFKHETLEKQVAGYKVGLPTPTQIP